MYRSIFISVTDEVENERQIKTKVLRGFPIPEYAVDVATEPSESRNAFNV